MPVSITSLAPRIGLAASPTLYQKRYFCQFRPSERASVQALVIDHSDNGAHNSKVRMNSSGLWGCGICAVHSSPGARSMTAGRRNFDASASMLSLLGRVRHHECRPTSVQREASHSGPEAAHRATGSLAAGRNFRGNYESLSDVNVVGVLDCIAICFINAVPLIH
jgi:hypothetical protein